MPYANVSDENQDKMHSCVLKLTEKGEDEKAAIAICYASIEGKSASATKYLAGLGVVLDDPAVKVGARNAAADLKRIEAIHTHATEILNHALGLGYAPPAPVSEHEQRIAEANAETALVMGGKSIKALGDGRIGGYLVVFGDEGQTDLEGDYFTKATDFGKHATSPVYYHHGLDDTLKRRVLSDAALKADDVGVWAETQLKLADEYERFLYRMAEAGKAGWSSGTASHLVEREERGKAAWVKRWPLGLDASITLTPAEPRARALPIKSLPDAPALKALLQAAGDAANAGDATGAGNQSIKSSEVNEMDEKEKAELAATLKTLADATAANAEAIKALTPKPGSAAIVESSGGFAEVKAADVLKTPYKPFKDFGYGDFVKDVITASKPGAVPPARLTALRDEREKALKAILGANETVASEGGWLTQADHETELIKLMHDSAVYSSRVNSRTLGGQFNSTTTNGLDETSRATGSRWGGIVGYRVAEGIAPTASNPKFRKIELKLKDYAAAAYLTNDVIQDAAMLQGEITDGLPKELAFLVDDDVQNGLGVAGCLGWLVSPALITVTKENNQTATTILFENIIKMYTRRWARNSSNYAWFINQDIEPQLFSMSMKVGTGGVPVYMPAGGVSGAPYATLLGRPIIPTEFCATLGTKGDINLVDLSQYKFIDKGGVQTMMSIHVEFLSGQTVVKSVYRCDGQPIWASALTPYKGSSTVSPFIALETRS